MILVVRLGESVRDEVLLSIIRSDDVDAVASESLLWDYSDFTVQLLGFIKGCTTQILHPNCSFNLCIVAKGCSFDLLLAIFDINEQEWLIREKYNFLLIANVATPDHVIVKKSVGHLHQSLVHTILRVKETRWVACLDQALEERCWSIHFECQCGTELILIAYKDNLLGVERREEGLVLLDHRGFIHYYSREMAFSHRSTSS